MQNLGYLILYIFSYIFQQFWILVVRPYHQTNWKNTSWAIKQINFFSTISFECLEIVMLKEFKPLWGRKGYEYTGLFYQVWEGN